jgi:glutamyl-tRNA reductase
VLVAIGQNQRSATVADREALAIADEALPGLLLALCAADGVDEVAVVSTCYRVEVYASTARPAAARAGLRAALEARAGRPLPLVELEGAEAFRHLVRVASSLESAILGEPQILGQVKVAFQRAAEAGIAGKRLAAVLARTLAIAKRVRTETALGRAGVSWGHAATVLAEKVLGSLAGKRAVVIGAGEMARLTAQHLRDGHVSLTILNRTLAHAEALAAEVGGVAGPLDRLEKELLHADLVVSAAPVVPAALAPAALERTMRARRRRLVLVDLAVPRAVPAESGLLPDVYLGDVDDLDRLTKAALAQRTDAAREADQIVDEEVRRVAADEAERRAAPIIREIRTRAGRIAEEEVERTLQRLGHGGDLELGKRLEAMANAIVAKLLHAPSARLREAVRERGPEDALVAAAVEIFGLGQDATYAAQPLTLSLSKGARRGAA